MASPETIMMPLDPDSYPRRLAVLPPLDGVRGMLSDTAVHPDMVDYTGFWLHDGPPRQRQPDGPTAAPESGRKGGQ